jgi:hypothetical protein
VNFYQKCISIILISTLLISVVGLKNHIFVHDSANVSLEIEGSFLKTSSLDCYACHFHTSPIVETIFTSYPDIITSEITTRIISQQNFIISLESLTSSLRAPPEFPLV